MVFPVPGASRVPDDVTDLISVGGSQPSITLQAGSAEALTTTPTVVPSPLPSPIATPYPGTIVYDAVALPVLTANTTYAVYARVLLKESCTGTQSPRQELIGSFTTQ